jgi:hypothetical protein
MEASVSRLPPLPDSPAGRQLAWWLAMLESGGEGAGPGDLARFAEPLRRVMAPLTEPESRERAWAAQAARLGRPVELSLETDEPLRIVAAVTTDKDRRWTLTLAVAPDPPHPVASFEITRRHEFQLEVREAGEGDALILADIERRCPMVLGETSVWLDRGADYLASTRLMEDCTIGLASVDGTPAALSCGAEHTVRIGGKLFDIVTVSHLRVLPEHQRKGLWGAANGVLNKYWDHVDGSSAYIAVANAGMRHGFANTPDGWEQIVQRAQLDCAALAGPRTGRAATPTDAEAIVRKLNGFHGDEEMFVPYTAQSFAARVERAPDLYGWERVWLTDGAVVGVWPAGRALKTVSETAGVRHETLPGVVLDYACEAGAEAELEGLLRAWCGDLAGRGLDTLVLYTSPASPAAALLTGLARDVGDFLMWTPGVPVPPGAARRGLYTDAVYF